MTYTEWDDLPESVRTAVQDSIGPVAGSTNLAAGQNNDLALRLDLPSGLSVFCKGVRGGGRRAMFLDNEITTNARTGGIAPAVLCGVELDDWKIAGFEFVPGRRANLSPGSADLDRIARTIDTMSTLAAGDTRPLSLRWRSTNWWRKLADKTPDMVRGWDMDALDHLSERCPSLVTGDRLTHTDLHADQFLISDTQVRVIDWAFPAAAAPWVDATFLVIRLMLAGHHVAEAEAWARGVRCWADAPEQAVAAFAAYVAGMWSCWAVQNQEPDAVRRAEIARAYAAWRCSGVGMNTPTRNR
jgi:hypothetical protein